MKFEEFKTRFFRGNVDKRYMISQIKNEFSDLDSLKKFINRFRKEIKIANSLLNIELVGKYKLPKSYSEIKKERLQYRTESIIKEVNWLVIGFIENYQIINSFIVLRSDFENFLMLGDYPNARLALEKIETEICLSLWTLENRFILDEQQYGSQKNWEFRNTVVDEKNEVFVQAFGNLFSLKAENRISFFQYNEDFSEWEIAQGLTVDPQHEGIKEYFRYRANFLSKSYVNYTDLFFIDSNSTLIDRYLLFNRVIQQLLTENFSENDQVLNAVLELSEFIDDICLEQIIVAQDSTYSIKNDKMHSNILSAIDEYTKGNYFQSKNICVNLINTGYANIPELYEIYVKSLIENKQEYEKITTQNSFVNSITSFYYHVLSKSPNSDEGFIELLKIAYLFNNSSIGLTIYDFVKDELGWTNTINYSYLARLNSKFLNPKILNHLYSKEGISKNILDNLEKKFPTSSTIHVYSEFYRNLFNDSIDLNYEFIPKVKNEIYRLRWLFLRKKYKQCIVQYKEILKEEISPILEYEALNGLYFSYLMENDYRNNVILYVESFLKNSQFVKKFNTSEVIEAIVDSKFKNIGDKTLLIELPIFFKLISTDKIKIKQSCELFLASNGFNKPSDLIKNSHLFDKDKITYFLSIVCVIEVLQLSKSYDSTYDVNEERIKICQFLANFDVANVKKYNMEIALLTQKNTISKVIGKIDEGKIYVNEEKIKQIFVKTETKNEFSKIKELSGDNFLTKEFFLRTLDLKKFVQNNEFKKSRNVVFIDLDNEGNVNNNPAFADFKKMFLELRNYFVWSKEYGLDAYLSTRIRHGTLVNHIRSVFELFNLVTTQVEGNYAENVYWKEKLNQIHRGDEIQNLLINFSKNIDLILISLKEEVIQCKTEQILEKKEGLFDFTYKHDIHLMIIYMSKTESYEEFISVCFDELWGRTNSCLETIKVALDEQIKEGFVQLLTKLENDLVKSHKKAAIAELLNSVNLCRTEIQTKMNNVIKWFNRSESTFEGEYDLEILVDTSVQITKNIHPTYNFGIEKNIPNSIKIGGENHQHIIDLINNCLFNMIKHSSLESQELKAKISIIEKDEDLEIRFINIVADAQDHISKLSLIKENWLNPDLNITKEGGTGFPKIKKIIHSDLSRKFSKFDYYFDNNLLTIALSFETKDL